MDLSPEGVQSTSKWALEEGLHVDVRQGDMLSLPYEEASFDCLFAYHVISHTDTPGVKKIISEIQRVVKPGGEIYVTLCSKETWSYKDAGFPILDENTVLKTDGP
jgi:ubiquinone/menaquinone biosynthesis C-methylase UbiE